MPQAVGKSSVQPENLQKDLSVLGVKSLVCLRVWKTRRGEQSDGRGYNSEAECSEHF